MPPLMVAGVVYADQLLVAHLPEMIQLFALQAKAVDLLLDERRHCRHADSLRVKTRSKKVAIDNAKLILGWKVFSANTGDHPSGG